MADPRTDGPEPGTSDPGRAPDGQAVGADDPGSPVAPTRDAVGRRSFFRQLAGELIQGAGQLSGVATMAQGAVAGVAAATDELTAGSAAAPAAPAAAERVPGRLLPRGVVVPWIEDGDTLQLVDLRRLPGVLAAFPVRTTWEAARAIRERVVIGPSAAVLAARMLAGEALRVVDRPAETTTALVEGAIRALRAADPGSVCLAWAIDRVVAAGPVAAAMVAAAADLATELTSGHRALADDAARVLGSLGVRRPLLHGPSGRLWGAGEGTALDAALAAGIEEVFVTEGRPGFEGARVTAWELVERGTATTVVLDAAGPGLLAGGRADALLLAADAVAADGSARLPLGSLGLALAAADAGVPVVVLAAAWADRTSASDGSTPTVDPVPAAVLERAAGTLVVAAGARVDGTRTEWVPGRLIDHVVHAA